MVKKEFRYANGDRFITKTIDSGAESHIATVREVDVKLFARLYGCTSFLTVNYGHSLSITTPTITKKYLFHTITCILHSTDI